MRDVLPEIEKWEQEGEQIALATVVRITGSAPRPVGGKLAVTKSARMAGSVSGGCVEGAVYELALEALASGRPRLARYGISDEMAWDVGLSCGGEIDVFIEPYRGAIQGSVEAQIREVIASESAAAQATGLSRDVLGAKLLVYQDGRRAGSLGPAGLDDVVKGDALDLISRAGAETRTYSAGSAELEIFIESYLPPRRLVIVGASHHAIPLVSFARELGYYTVVIDARAFFATRERFPHADELIVGWPDEVLAQLPLGPQTDIVLLSHEAKFEDPTLEVALKSPVGYIGAIGSRKTTAARNERLRSAGYTDKQIGQIHGPIGIDIGASTPAEIAISILAEIIAVRSGRNLSQVSSRSSQAVVRAGIGG